MAIGTILFILILINYFNKRCENTSMIRPKRILPKINYSTWPHLLHILASILKHLSRDLIYLLLMIGGIELNPGPSNMDKNYLCKTCLLTANLHMIECSTCSKDYDILEIHLPIFTYHYLIAAKGKFTYICKHCCDSYEEELIVSKYSLENTAGSQIDTTLANNTSHFLNKTLKTCEPHKTSDNTAASSPTSIITRKRHLHRIHTGTYEKNPDHVLPAAKTVTPLLSLTLKPPPISILRKWWCILNISLPSHHFPADINYGMAGKVNKTFKTTRTTDSQELRSHSLNPSAAPFHPRETHSRFRTQTVNINKRTSECRDITNSHRNTSANVDQICAPTKSRQKS